jgi:hypothetical protein
VLECRHVSTCMGTEAPSAPAVFPWRVFKLVVINSQTGNRQTKIILVVEISSRYQSIEDNDMGNYL